MNLLGFYDIFLFTFSRNDWLPDVSKSILHNFMFPFIEYSRINLNLGGTHERSIKAKEYQ